MRSSTSSLNLDITDQHGADVSADVSTDVSAQSPPQLLRGRQQSLQLSQSEQQLQKEQFQNLAISADSGESLLCFDAFGGSDTPS
jgi:hypothetical protein